MDRPSLTWECFAHGADIGVRGRGPTRAAAFEGAAMALMAVITDPARVAPTQRVDLSCGATDDELLLVDWLNALVYEMDTRRCLFGRFEVEIVDGHLRSRCFGEPLDVARHRPAVEVKGATFTELAVRRNADGSWLAQCVVDV